MLPVILSAIFILLTSSGCTILHLYSSVNEARTDNPPPFKTRATSALTNADLAQGVFVGVAMSGGGARAANFSAAVLLELERLGFLQYASTISSVSGSSLTAAYYGLYAQDRTYWNVDTVRQRFLVDLQTHWLLRWFNPWNIIRYWFTDFDRSDIMAEVFDAYLFEGSHHPRFKDMGTGLPKILINSTSLPRVGPFLFTDEEFEGLGSRLDTYPLSHAVMASGAFPGAFHNVTLTNFKAAGYFQHLFDGGPSDNLGVLALLDIARQLRPHAGCFLFVVDAFPYNVGKGERRSDTREFFDFFVDHNAFDSADVFLTLRRYDTLQRQLGYPKNMAIGERPLWSFTMANGVECSVWHLTFQSLLTRPHTRDDLKEALKADQQVNVIRTRYRLEGPKGFSEKDVQDLLFSVAHSLVHEDAVPLTAACNWFRARKLDVCR